jgi:hypothetical protein
MPRAFGPQEHQFFGSCAGPEGGCIGPARRETAFLIWSMWSTAAGVRPPG